MTPNLSVEQLLDLDVEYRRRVAADTLPKIRPSKNNPTNAAWLPVWNTQVNGLPVTLLFSNTERAHQLGKTHDWVVCYAGAPQVQCTIVTEHQGPNAGKRVVRGREAEGAR